MADNSTPPENTEPITEMYTRLDDLRQAIDSIDSQILDLLNRRIRLGKEIGRVKQSKGTQVLDSARESEVMQRLFAHNRGPLNNSALHHIYKEIISASRNIQKPMQIAYLGPEASFTHMAAAAHFGRSATYSSQSSIADVFNEVEKGVCSRGVIPLENTREGSEEHALDLFFESELSICGEIINRNSHDLLSPTGVLETIRRVYAPAHAIARCRGWLGKYLPEVEIRECGTMADAARMVLVDETAGAITGREAALMWNLEVVASRIEDAPRTVTRYLVLGCEPAGPTGNDKTSVMFAIDHAPGRLHKTLAPLAHHRVNMVLLTSRPASHEDWHDFFFLDFEGHAEDPILRKTLEAMKATCRFFKCLGSYPKARE